MRQEHGMAYEDLRAANEELQTVNNELKTKLEEVSRANNDLENFMAATDIPILFLDRNLGIKRYTAALRQIFNVKPHDHGRPIGDLTHNMDYQDLEQDAARVLRDLVPIERRIKLRSGEHLLVRIRPYRTAEDEIDGVVVTYVSAVGA
jgi:two-component system CheB/CheR fusion protein